MIFKRKDVGRYIKNHLRNFWKIFNVTFKANNIPALKPTPPTIANAVKGLSSIIWFTVSTKREAVYFFEGKAPPTSVITWYTPLNAL